MKKTYRLMVRVELPVEGSLSASSFCAHDGRPAKRIVSGWGDRCVAMAAATATGAGGSLLMTSRAAAAAATAAGLRGLTSSEEPDRLSWRPYLLRGWTNKVRKSKGTGEGPRSEL